MIAFVWNKNEAFEWKKNYKSYCVQLSHHLNFATFVMFSIGVNMQSQYEGLSFWYTLIGVFEKISLGKMKYFFKDNITLT